MICLIKSKTELYLFLTLICLGCKVQLQSQIEIEQKLTNLNSNIIGTWSSDDESDYKLEFLNNGQCKEYENQELISVYNYTLEPNSCDNFNENDVIYLKWTDLEDFQITCFELQKITEDSLSIMIIDKARILFLNKE